MALSKIKANSLGTTGTPSSSNFLRGDMAWTAVAGDIESVTAGTGLNGGGSSGDVTLNVDVAQPTITSLANSVVISTSGAITTTGAFTSIGIDDNADALAITIDSAERVGIGTASPTVPLHVIGDVIIGGTTPTVTIGDGGAEDTAIIFSGNAVDWHISSDDSADDFVIGTGTTIGSNQKLVIDGGTGKVGIGTATPATILHVKATGGSGTETEVIRFETTGTNDNSAVVSDWRTSHIRGEINLLDDSGSYDSNWIFKTATGSALAAPTEKVRITSGGSVGIGTTTPGKQLHITKSAAADLVALADAATIAVDFDTGQNFTVTLGANRALGNPTNVTAGQTGSIFVTQDGTGSRTLSYSSSWEFPAATAPVLTTTAAAVDRIDYIVKGASSIQAVATLAYA